MILKNKKILIGVTGSIAIYKTLDLIRKFIKAGAEVRVIMTNSAKKFITPLTFETLSTNKVLDENSECWSSDYNHIGIGKWADIFIIAPATANTINKLSCGIADNLLTQTALAFTKHKIIAPAANTNMIQNPLTIKNIKNLKLQGYEILKTVSKELACKDVGNGAMSDPEYIFLESARKLLSTPYWLDRDVVLNGGGTIEKIDSVRYISNFSSGKMASSLALALFLKGANVSLIYTKNATKPIENINSIEVTSTKEMFEAINLELNNVNSKKKAYFFGVAAVSDFTPKKKVEGKIKKSSIGQEWKIDLVQNIDILDSIEKQNIYTIGFKAEFDATKAKEYAKNMLENKKIDGVCLNILSSSNNFGSDTNKIEFISKDNFSFTAQGQKLEVSLKLLENLQKSFNE
jgi:phosphopantothenoylcysteine decarboxylase/phosphopantothenate--cysteine ligase